MTYYLTILLAAGVLFGLVYSLFSTVFVAIDRRRRNTPIPVDFPLPGLTVFKPVKGLDEDLESNLRSFFEQDYPRFELIFGTDDFDDPALPVIRRLQKEYREVRSRIIVDSRRRGINPKVNNLINMESWANYDRYVISDSNVRVSREYLKRMAVEMPSEDVGLVTSVVRGMHAETIGAALENLHLNSYVAASVAATRRLFGVTIAVGKSMLIRRETLDRIGGFTAFRDILLEDHILGLSVDRLGLRVATSPHPVNNVNRTWSVRNFADRHIRWVTMRRYLHVGHYLAEILSHPTILAMLLWSISPTMFTLGLLITSLAAKGLFDMAACKLIGTDLRWWMYLLLPARDILIAGIWLAPLFGSTVTWRGNRYRLSKGTTATLEPDARALPEPDISAN